MPRYCAKLDCRALGEKCRVRVKIRLETIDRMPTIESKLLQLTKERLQDKDDVGGRHGSVTKRRRPLFHHNIFPE
jgi:hypothetical protein